MTCFLVFFSLSTDNIGHTPSLQGWGMKCRAHPSPQRSQPACSILPDLIAPSPMRQGANPRDGRAWGRAGLNPATPGLGLVPWYWNHPPSPVLPPRPYGELRRDALLCAVAQRQLSLALPLL